MRRDDDLFMIQVRLFRLAQQKWDLSAEECVALFTKYDVNRYIATCYEEYHVQGDEANLADLEQYIEKRKSTSESAGSIDRADRKEASKYEYTMGLLAEMASINIARQQKISRTKAFSRFMRSKTGEMLFDESTDLWMNGPDYIADEYRREKGCYAPFKRGK